MVKSKYVIVPWIYRVLSIVYLSFAGMVINYSIKHSKAIFVLSAGGIIQNLFFVIVFTSGPVFLYLSSYKIDFISENNLTVSWYFGLVKREYSMENVVDVKIFGKLQHVSSLIFQRPRVLMVFSDNRKVQFYLSPGNIGLLKFFGQSRFSEADPGTFRS